MNPQVIYILLVGLSLIGTVMLFLTVKKVIGTIKFLRTSLRAEGTVVRFDARRNSEGSTKHRAVVSFRTADNCLHEIRAGIAHDPAAPAIGKIITVRYLPDAPQKAKIESFWEIWESSLFYFSIFFAMFFLVSVLTIILLANNTA